MVRASTVERLRARHAARYATSVPVVHTDPALQEAAAEILLWISQHDARDGGCSSAVQLTSWMMEAARQLGHHPEYVRGYRIAQVGRLHGWVHHGWTVIRGETVDLGSAYEELSYRRLGVPGMVQIQLVTDPADLEGHPRFWTGAQAAMEDGAASLLDRFAANPILCHQALTLVGHPPGYYDSLVQRLSEIAARHAAR